MQVKSKIFPYPIINHNKYYSNYGECNFEFHYDDTEETDDLFVFKNARFETNSEYINSLYYEDKIKVYCIIECSATVYRKAIPMNINGEDIELKKVDFAEKVEISMMAVASKSFKYMSEEFDDEYQNIELVVEKNDIIGANDGINIYFKHDEKEDSFASSIFSIIANHEFEDGAYKVECGMGKKIVITMSDNDYKNYKVIHAMSIYQEVFFNMLLVPALVEGLSLCKTYLNENFERDLEDVGNNYLWFRTIIESYKKLKGYELSLDEFKGYSPVGLAQELLGKPIGKSLYKLLTDVSHKLEDDENE